MKFITLLIVPFTFKAILIISLNTNNVKCSPLPQIHFYIQQIQEDIKFFNNYERSSPLLHNLQIKFQCCGFNGPEDYKVSMKPSACKNVTRNEMLDKNSVVDNKIVNNYYEKGCAEVIQNYKPMYDNECERIFDEYEYHRQRFYIEMKHFEDEDVEFPWLNNIQKTYKCCGFNRPTDYKHFFKPPSCCSDRDKDSLKQCLDPPKNVEGSLGIPADYYAEGCSKHFQSIINEVIDDRNSFKTRCPNIFSQFEHNRNKFIQTIKHFDESGILHSWLDDIQTQYHCCGYDGPQDYVKLVKPSSCRDNNGNNRELVAVYNQVDNSDEAPQYYSQGCAQIVNRNSTKNYQQSSNVVNENPWFILIAISIIFVVCFIFLLPIIFYFYSRNKKVINV